MHVLLLIWTLPEVVNTDMREPLHFIRTGMITADHFGHCSSKPKTGTRNWSKVRY